MEAKSGLRYVASKMGAVLAAQAGPRSINIWIRNTAEVRELLLRWLVEAERGGAWLQFSVTGGFRNGRMHLNVQARGE